MENDTVGSMTTYPGNGSCHRDHKKKKRDDIHSKNSTSSGCETKGSSRDADETRLEEGNPSQSHLETLLPSQNDIGHSSRCKRHKKRLREVSDFPIWPLSIYNITRG